MSPRGLPWLVALGLALAAMPAAAADGDLPAGVGEVSPPPSFSAPVVHRDTVPLTAPVRESLLAVIARPDDKARIGALVAALKQAGHPLPKLSADYSFDPAPGLTAKLGESKISHVDVMVDIDGVVEIGLPSP